MCAAVSHVAYARASLATQDPRSARVHATHFGSSRPNFIALADSAKFN